MKSPSASQWEEALNLSFDGKNEPWLTTGYTLRKLIGMLGMALPTLLSLNGVLVHDWGTPYPSLSHYYYTWAGSPFTITLSGLAVGSDPERLVVRVINGQKGNHFTFPTLRFEPEPPTNIGDRWKMPDRIGKGIESHSISYPFLSATTD
ncbi:MAG TPA: hypothetical protein VHK69_09720 [Chitinophagaceae bacterium]|jgi:hypothetical protein|nr:hypothetical protein [Chitinophagaceae bacterium]